MKTKLLRKVRKEFKIEFWPNGVKGAKWPQMYLKRFGFRIHKHDMWLSFHTKKNGIEKMHSVIIDILRRRYPHLGSYRKKFTKQQIWP